MTTKCGIRGIKSIEKTQNIEDKMYCSKSRNKKTNKGDIKAET
jgi:hypothetical protein